MQNYFQLQTLLSSTSLEFFVTSARSKIAEPNQLLLFVWILSVVTHKIFGNGHQVATVFLGVVLLVIYFHVTLVQTVVL